MTTDITASYEAAARCFADLVGRIPAGAWSDPGLGEWDLRALVGHTGRSLSTVTTYLGQPAPAVQVPSSVDYYEFVVRYLAADPSAVTERGREAGLALGDDPVGVITGLVNEALTALGKADGDPVIQTIAGGMRLSDYLPTRLFELAVHTLDIAAATGLDVTVPPPALAGAVHLAADLALRKGDGPTLLFALTGRGVLPAGYSVV